MPPARSANPPTNHYAGLVTRAVALAIDAATLSLVVSILTAVVGLIISLFTKVDTGSSGAILGALGSWTVIVAAYFTFCWAAAGQTLGQHVMQIRVQRVNGQRMGLLRSYARFLALSLCMGPLILGQLLVLFTPRRRALHDLMVRTVVVYTDAVGRELSEPEHAGDADPARATHRDGEPVAEQAEPAAASAGERPSPSTDPASS